jgi:hypothetical protein
MSLQRRLVTHVNYDAKITIIDIVPEGMHRPKGDLTVTAYAY